jgi:hypothetical protein
VQTTPKTSSTKPGAPFSSKSTKGIQLIHRLKSASIRANPRLTDAIGCPSVLGFYPARNTKNGAFFAHFAPKTEKTRKKPVETP